MLLAVSWSQGLCVSWVECIWSAETGFGSHPDHKRSRPPTSTVLDVLSTVSARAENRSVHMSWYARFKRVRSNNLSTQLRRTRTSSTVSPPVPTTVADPEQTADSELIRVATIALHIEKEKTQTLQKPRSLNGRHFHSLRVSHLLLWADLHFCNSCYSLWEELQMVQIAPFDWRRYSTAFL